MQTQTRQKLIATIHGYLANSTTAMSNAVFTNPVAVYASSERLNLEKQTLFRDYPILMAMSCQLANAGDYLTEDFSGTPLLLVRQKNGALSGFINACAHRGAPVAQGAVSRDSGFTCPYHAWSYELDGRLRNIPGEEGFTCINRDEYGLKPIPVIEKYGMVWAVPNPSIDAAPIDIDAYLGDLAPEYASYEFSGYHHFATQILEPKINWKMAVDGFLESYHLSVLHPKTVAPLYFTNRNTADGFGLNHRMVAVRKSFNKVSGDAELERDFLLHTNILYTLFPNTMFVYQRDHLEVWRMFPDGQDPNSCKMVLSMYTPELVTSDSAQRHWEKNLRLALDTVETEDLMLGEKIQRGYQSGAQAFVTYGRNEVALAHFHASLDKALAVDDKKT
jgi:phenylpropionate dioxygenase-like ring-hydroxylating dioxygenase large terminal subunit